MIIDNSHRLQVGVDYNWAEETESSFNHVLAHSLGKVCTGRKIRQACPGVYNRFVVNKAPDIIRKASELLLNRYSPFPIMVMKIRFILWPGTSVQGVNSFLSIIISNQLLKLIKPFWFFHQFKNYSIGSFKIDPLYSFKNAGAASYWTVEVFNFFLIKFCRPFIDIIHCKRNMVLSQVISFNRFIYARLR